MQNFIIKITDETINQFFGGRRDTKLDIVRWKGTVWFRVEDDLDKPDDIRWKWINKKRAARLARGLHPLTLEERGLEEAREELTADDEDDAFVKAMREAVAGSLEEDEDDDEEEEEEILVDGLDDEEIE